MAQRASQRPGKARKSPAGTGKSASLPRNAQQHSLSGRRQRHPKRTLLFLTTAGNSYAFKNEPEGFRGVQWGDSPSVLENKQQWLADGNTNYFIKPDDEMRVGGATVSLIVYEFWKDRFASAIIHTKGRTHWKTLKTAVFERFGAGKKKNTYKEEYR